MRRLSDSWLTDLQAGIVNVALRSQAACGYECPAMGLDDCDSESHAPRQCFDMLFLSVYWPAYIANACAPAQQNSVTC